MKIYELIESLKNKSAKEIEDMAVVSRYVPISRKRIVARDILNKCIDDASGFIVIDGIDREVYFTMAVLQEYTCAEVSTEYDVVLEEYDMLCVADVFETLVTLIGDDVAELLNVIDEEEKMILARNSIEAQVARAVNGFTETVAHVSDAMTSSLSNFDINKMLPQGTTLNDVVNLISKYK